MTQIQILPNGNQIQFGSDGNVRTIQGGMTTPDLMGMLYGPRGQDPRAGVFGPFAGASADTYGHFAGTLNTGINNFGGMANAYAHAGNALAGMAQAGANSDAARYNAYSRNTTDYQNMLGSLGVGALGAYGNASNAAMQSQAMRDTAAMKMFADSASANQAALASYGGQQAMAQAAIGNSAANAGTGLAGARAGIGNALSGLGAAGMKALAAGELGRSIGGGMNFGNSRYAINGPGGNIASTGGMTGGVPGGVSPPAQDGGVLGALNSSQAAINNQGAGIDRDSDNTFASLGRASDRVADRGILDSLNQNYGRSWNDMMQMYQSGRQDPRNLLKDIYQGTLGIASPFLTAGREAFGATMNNLPQSSVPAIAGGYMAGLNGLLNTQNQNIINTMNAGLGAFNNQMTNLNAGYGGAMTALANAPYGGGMGGGTGFIKKIVNGQEVWEPVGPNIYSPESRFVQGNYGQPGYTQAGSGTFGGGFSMPSFGTQIPPSSGGSQSPNVQRAQNWANQAQMAQRWQYYQNLPEWMQRQNQYNPAAQAEMDMLRQWKTGKA